MGKNGSETKSVLWLATILILAAFLRFYNLGGTSLWTDELETWRIASFPDFSEMMNQGIIPDVHPPGYQMLIFLIVKYIGNSEFLLRLPSAIAGILSVWVIFLIGRKLYTEREGLISAGLTATLWCPIFYSQEARSYSLLLLFTMLTAYYLLEIYKNPDRKPIFIRLCFIVSSIITSYIHYYGTFALALLFLTALFVNQGKKDKPYKNLSLILPAAIAYIVWIPVFIKHLSSGPIWIQSPKTLAFGYFLAFLFNNSVPLLALVLLIIITGIIAERKLYRGNGKYRTTIYLMAWLIVPFFLVFIKSLLSTPVLTYRNLIISLPAAYLLLARSISLLPFKKMLTAIAPTAIIALFLADLIFITEYYSNPYKNYVRIAGMTFTKPHKEQYEEAVVKIIEENTIYQPSLIIGYAWYTEYFNYYFNKFNSGLKVDLKAGEAADTSSVSKLVNEKKPVYIWFISAHKDPDPAFMNYMDNAFVRKQYHKFADAQVILYVSSIHKEM